MQRYENESCSLRIYATVQRFLRVFFKENIFILQRCIKSDVRFILGLLKINAALFLYHIFHKIY